MMKSDADNLPCKDANSDNPLNLSTIALEKIDTVCLKFEQQWQSGPRPSLNEYLLEENATAKAALLRELILLDVDYRISLGESPTRDDYADHLRSSDPELTETIFNLAVGTRTSATSDTEPAQPKQIPQTLGRYRILELVGEGGFGNVYRAHDTQLKRDVAIKVPHSRLDGHVQASRLFRNEAQTVASLRHPAIVPVFDVHFDPSRLSSCFIVSQFMEGGNLNEYAAGRKIPAQEAANIVARAAEALHYAHEQGLVHRDVKLSNILRDSSGDVFVADFGLAECGQQIESGEGFAGTPATMSPEQASGDAQNVDRRSDVYGLGVVLYELLTGKRPFEEKDLDALLHQIENSPPRPPREINTTIPIRLEHICLRALAKAPADRFPTAKDMAAELRQHSDTPTEKKSRQFYWLPAAAIVVAACALMWFRGDPGPTAITQPTSTVRSLAVLPFTSTGTGDTIDYRGVSISDSLNSRLGHLQQIIVRPTQSVRRLAVSSKTGQTNQSVAQLGRQLQVDAILQGSVQETVAGTLTKVQLVQVENGATLWNATFDHRATNLLEMQDIISSQVANALVSQLSAGEKKRVQQRPTNNQQAYEAYVKGRYHWNQRSTHGTTAIDKAIEYFKAAIDADPLFAKAYSGLAESYAMSNTWSATMDQQALPRARAAALKALEIDNKLHDAHATLGLVLFYHDWDWDGAEKEFRRAIELNPNYATAHQWFGETLYFCERFDESVVELQKAADLDPLSEVIASLQGAPPLFRRDYKTARTEYQRALKVFPKSAIATWGLAIISEDEGKLETALGYYRQAGSHYSQAYLMAKLGRIDEAKKARQKYVNHEPFPAHPYHIAIIDVGLSDFDSAFAWLEKAREIRDERLVWLKVDPRLDPLRSDPRFAKLLKDVGWTEQASNAQQDHQEQSN